MLVSRILSCLRHVHIDRRLRDHAMAIAHGRGGDGLVVVGLRPVQQQVFARKSRGDLLHHRVVLLEMAGAGDDERHADSLQHRPHNVGRLFGRFVAVVGMRTREPYADDLARRSFVHADTAPSRPGLSASGRKRRAGCPDSLSAAWSKTSIAITGRRPVCLRSGGRAARPRLRSSPPRSLCRIRRE